MSKYIYVVLISAVDRAVRGVAERPPLLPLSTGANGSEGATVAGARIIRVACRKSCPPNRWKSTTIKDSYVYITQVNCVLGQSRTWAMAYPPRDGIPSPCRRWCIHGSTYHVTFREYSFRRVTTRVFLAHSVRFAPTHPSPVTSLPLPALSVVASTPA